MAVIKVVLDAKLLKAANIAAKKEKVNRSSLIRSALRYHLMRLLTLELEEQERQAYLAKPQQPEEYLPWLKISEWPED
jgi:metal-responsive CopG/Arc/MetJ family transcriptional regulator